MYQHNGNLYSSRDCKVPFKNAAASAAAADDDSDEDDEEEEEEGDIDTLKRLKVFFCIWLMNMAIYSIWLMIYYTTIILPCSSRLLYYLLGCAFNLSHTNVTGHLHDTTYAFENYCYFVISIFENAIIWPDVAAYDYMIDTSEIIDRYAACLE